MTMTYDKFTDVLYCVARKDGGSLVVQLTGPEGKAGFTLGRSIASRGTPLFGKVSADNGQFLTAQETHELCRLRELQDTMLPSIGLVQEFIRAAEQYGV